MLRLCRTLLRRLPPDGLTPPTPAQALCRRRISCSGPTPEKITHFRFREMGDSTLNVAIRSYLDLSYPYLGDEPFNICHAHYSNEELISFLDYTQMSVGYQNLHTFRDLWQISGEALDALNRPTYEPEMFWEKFKHRLDPIVTLEDVEKLQKTSLLLRASRQWNELQKIEVYETDLKEPKPLSKFAQAISDESEEIKLHQYIGRGELALEITIRRYLSTAYPELRVGQLNALCAANISRKKLISVNNILRRNHMVKDFEDVGIYYYGDGTYAHVLAMAGFIYEKCYDLEEFWKELKGLLEPIISWDDLEKQRASVQ